MKFEFDKKETNEIRNLVKNLYESLGHMEGVISTGHKMIDAQLLVDLYKSYIYFVESVVLDEPYDEFHKRNND